MMRARAKGPGFAGSLSDSHRGEQELDGLPVHGRGSFGPTPPHSGLSSTPRTRGRTLSGWTRNHLGVQLVQPGYVMSEPLSDPAGIRIDRHAGRNGTADHGTDEVPGHHP